MANLKESEIERSMVRRVRESGGLCYKFQSPGNPGVPDRIILTRDGRTVYVELKTEIDRLAKIQAWQIGEMRKRGADVRVVRGAAEMRALVEELFPA